MKKEIGFKVGALLVSMAIIYSTVSARDVESKNPSIHGAGDGPYCEDLKPHYCVEDPFSPCREIHYSCDMKGPFENLDKCMPVYDANGNKVQNCSDSSCGGSDDRTSCQFTGA